MEKAIWKYELEMNGRQEIEMPRDAEIISIQNQREKACIWAIVEPKAPMQKVTFEFFATGAKLPDISTRKYIGTVLFDEGLLAFHYFMVL